MAVNKPLLQTIFIPQEATSLQQTFVNAHEVSHERCGNFAAAAYGLQSIVYSFANMGIFLFYAGEALVSGNAAQVGTALLAVLQSLLYFVCSLFVVLLGLCFPETIFGAFVTPPALQQAKPDASHAPTSPPPPLSEGGDLPRVVRAPRAPPLSPPLVEYADGSSRMVAMDLSDPLHTPGGTERALRGLVDRLFTEEGWEEEWEWSRRYALVPHAPSPAAPPQRRTFSLVRCGEYLFLSTTRGSESMGVMFSPQNLRTVQLLRDHLFQFLAASHFPSPRALTAPGANDQGFQLMPPRQPKRRLIPPQQPGGVSIEVTDREVILSQNRSTDGAQEQLRFDRTNLHTMRMFERLLREWGLQLPPGVRLPPAPPQNGNDSFRWRHPQLNFPAPPQSFYGRLFVDGGARYKAEKYLQYFQIFHPEQLKPLNLSTKGVPSGRYKGLVRALRKVGQDPKYHDLIIHRWTGWEPYGYFHDSVGHLISAYCASVKNPPALPQLSLVTLPDFLQQMNEMLQKAPQSERVPLIADGYGRVQGAAGIKDFPLSPNIPNVRQHFQITDGSKKRNIIYLRHPCPTMNDNYVQPYIAAGVRILAPSWAPSTGERVADDYVHFITALKARNEGFLYVSHQRPWMDRGENEQDRVAALVALEKTHSNFYLLLQPVEGPLFKDKAILTPVKLKEAIIAAFSTPQKELNRDYFPQVIPPEHRSKSLHHLLQETQQLFFPGYKEDQVLTEDERSVFIHLFYFLQRMDLIAALPVSYCSTVCKDDIDRGGVQGFIHDLLMAYLTGTENSKERLEELVYNLLGPSVMIRKGEVISHRLDDGLRVAVFLQKFLSEGAHLERLRKYAFHGAWTVKHVIVNKPQPLGHVVRPAVKK